MSDKVYHHMHDQDVSGRLPIGSESCQCSRRSIVRPKSGKVTASLHQPKSPQQIRMTPGIKNVGLPSQLNSGMSLHEWRRPLEYAESDLPIDIRPCPWPQSSASVGRLLPGSANPRDGIFTKAIRFQDFEHLSQGYFLPNVDMGIMGGNTALQPPYLFVTIA